MAEPNLQEIHDFMIEIAEKAGKMITSASPAASSEKKNSADIVTETDQAVEAMVSTSLHEKYPTFKYAEDPIFWQCPLCQDQHSDDCFAKLRFMGEETYKPGDTLTDDPTFICDPIDGTTNFYHFYPYVSISLGLTINKTPTVGVVHNPFTQTLYTAIAGRGARRNRTTPLPLKSPSATRALDPLHTLQDALVALEWGSDRSGPDFELKSRMYARLARRKEEGGGMVRGIRSLGSAALNLCGVAEGTLDVYWESGCWAWDVCAGWLMVKESGGMMVDGNPGNWEPSVDGRRYLALRRGAEAKVVEEFWGYMDERLSYGP